MSAKSARPVRITKLVLRAYINDTNHLIRNGPQERLRAWMRQAVERIRAERSGELIVYSRLPEDEISLSVPAW